MKQTAVEWLIEKVNGQSTGLGMYGMNVRIDIPADIIQQAKEMEKEQMIDWYATGQADTVNMYEQHLNKNSNTNEK